MRVGQMLKSKQDKFYLKFENLKDKEGNIVGKNAITFPIVINEGDVLYLNKPGEVIDFLVSKGDLTAEEGDLKKSRIPDFVKFNIDLPTVKA